MSRAERAWSHLWVRASFVLFWAILPLALYAFATYPCTD